MKNNKTYDNDHILSEDDNFGGDTPCQHLYQLIIAHRSDELISEE